MMRCVKIPKEEKNRGWSRSEGGGVPLSPPCASAYRSPPHHVTLDLLTTPKMRTELRQLQTTMPDTRGVVKITNAQPH